MSSTSKLQPRNMTALHASLSKPVMGNPATTRLESGVGNCYPGLEFDTRNFERRFFPHLVVDFEAQVSIDVPEIVAVDIDRARQDPAIGQPGLSTYDLLAQELALDRRWFILGIDGNFGPFGDLDLNFADIPPRGQPSRLDLPDEPWTAIRLIPEGALLTLTLVSIGGGSATLSGRRQAYVGEDGALAPMFRAGELSQSLCSPWTHDFADCGCFYWASNHPDTVQSQRLQGAPVSPDTDQFVVWQRTAKGTANQPAAADTAGLWRAPNGAIEGVQRPAQITHYEINHRWNELGVVLDGREQGDVYAPSMLDLNVPLIPAERVAEYLRYAAAVEHSVMGEYLAAAYSLNLDAAAAAQDDARAAFVETLRIAYGEMRHIRLVNDVLRGWRHDRGEDFEPVLNPAAELPAGGGASRPVAFRPYTKAALETFLDIERPSFSVDGLYTRLLASLRALQASPVLIANIETIMAEGSEHYETFLFIREWLAPHAEVDYLVATAAPSGQPEHLTLQTRYRDLVELLHGAYTKGLPAGAAEVNQARSDMVSTDGLKGACEALRDTGVLVTLEPIADPRFAPVPRPL